MNPMAKRQKRTKAFRQFQCAIVAIAICVWFPGRTWAGEPTEQLRTTVNAVRAVLKENPRFESAVRLRQDRVRRLIDSRFDFNEIARRSLASHWKSLSPREQGEFVGAFKGLLEMAYATLIASQDGDKILYQRETREEDSAQVDTTIVTKRGEALAVNYRMHSLDGTWKIYDLVIENISVVNNYRSQFSRVIAKSSYSELLDRMKEKQSRASGRKRGEKEQLVFARKNIADESRPLIIVSLISSANEKQFFSSPSR